jgi:hypothetical protein
MNEEFGVNDLARGAFEADFGAQRVDRRRCATRCMVHPARRANQLPSLSSPLAKNILLPSSGKSNLALAPSCSKRGALRTSRSAVRDAMDADVLPTNSA